MSDKTRLGSAPFCATMGAILGVLGGGVLLTVGGALVEGPQGAEWGMVGFIIGGPIGFMIGWLVAGRLSHAVPPPIPPPDAKHGASPIAALRDNIVGVLALLATSVLPMAAPLLVAGGALTLNRRGVTPRQQAFAWAVIVLGAMWGIPFYLLLLFRE